MPSSARSHAVSNVPAHTLSPMCPLTRCLQCAHLLSLQVIDPATVTQQAVLNSCSIAASVLTTSALITEIKEAGDDGMMGGEMGGMM